jgi:AcrR family transcriptional regulator
MKHLPGAEAAPERVRSRLSDACAEGSHQIAVEGGMDNTRGEKICPRTRILSVAAELFHRHGIRSVGVEAIAEAADTSKMTLYRHFASKDELIAQYLRHFTELARSERPEPVDPAEAVMLLRTWLSEMADHLNDPDGRGCRFANAAVEFAGQIAPGAACDQDVQDRPPQVAYSTVPSGRAQQAGHASRRIVSAT